MWSHNGSGLLVGDVFPCFVPGVILRLPCDAHSLTLLVQGAGLREIHEIELDLLACEMARVVIAD